MGKSGPQKDQQEDQTREDSVETDDKSHPRMTNERTRQRTSKMTRTEENRKKKRVSVMERHLMTLTPPPFHRTEMAMASVHPTLSNRRTDHLNGSVKSAAQ